MGEVLSDQVELIENIPQKITEFLEYGLNNSGWNTLLDIGVLEKDIFLLSANWEEVKVLIKSSNSEGSNLLEKGISEINDKFSNLDNLSKRIITILYEKISQWTEIEGIKLRHDAGVVLRSLESVNFNQLEQDKRQVLDNLVRLLDEFVTEYEEWQILKEDKIEKLNKILKKVANERGVITSDNSIKSIPPDPSKATKQTRNDTRWGWNNIRNGS